MLTTHLLMRTIKFTIEKTMTIAKLDAQDISR